MLRPCPDNSPLNRQIPMANACIAAGFPSPADDYIDSKIDLNQHLIRHPASTFCLRVSGESMTGSGVHNNDLLIVDRSINAKPGHVVVAILDGEFTLKRLMVNQDGFYLKASHPEYPEIDLRKHGDVQIWGVAIYSIHCLKKEIY